MPKTLQIKCPFRGPHSRPEVGIEKKSSDSVLHRHHRRGYVIRRRSHGPQQSRQRSRKGQLMGNLALTSNCLRSTAEPQALRPSRQSRSAQFLGNVLRPLQGRDALVCRAAKRIRPPGIPDRRRSHGRRQHRRHRQIRQGNGVNYPILIGKDSVGESYGGVSVLPTTFFLDRDGKLIAREFGLQSRSVFVDHIKRAMSQGQAVQAQK